MAIIFTLRSYGRRVSRKLEGGTTVLRHLKISSETYLFQLEACLLCLHHHLLPATRMMKRLLLRNARYVWTKLPKTKKGLPPHASTSFISSASTNGRSVSTPPPPARTVARLSVKPRVTRTSNPKGSSKNVKGSSKNVKGSSKNVKGSSRNAKGYILLLNES